MTWFFGMFVAVVSLIGLVLFVMWLLHRTHNPIWIAIILLCAASYLLMLGNGILSGTGLSWPIEFVPACLATISTIGFVIWLLRRRQGQHGHGGGFVVDRRWQAAGVFAALVFMVAVWWGPLTSLPNTNVPPLTPVAQPAATTAPNPSPAKETISAQQCARYPLKARRAMGCP